MAQATTNARPEDVIRRIGDSNERAMAYVLAPDPQLSRLSRKVRESIIADLPPVTAGALLGPAALARHFVASAASGRYRDLFALWELFRQRPDECRPVLAERQKALEKGRMALGTAVRLGLSGRAERVARDVRDAQGLIWTWLREVLDVEQNAVAARPAIASAWLHREPDVDLPLPDDPDDRWLAEAAEARREGPLAPPVERLLAENAGRLPATIATLSLAFDHYPDQAPGLVSRIDLDSPQIGALLAWARDHGLGDQVAGRVRATVEEAAGRSRAEGAAAWYSWRQRGVDVPLPAALRSPDLDGLDVSRPDTAALAAALIADGAPLDMQAVVADLAGKNRQLAEKAYEAYVCAGLPVTLPAGLANNPLVKEGTRCPWCQSWTYVRAGHERRCPRRPEGEPVAEAPAEPAAPQPAASPEADAVTAAWDAAAAAESSMAPTNGAPHPSAPAANGASAEQPAPPAASVAPAPPAAPAAEQPAAASGTDTPAAYDAIAAATANTPTGAAPAPAAAAAEVTAATPAAAETAISSPTAAAPAPAPEGAPTFAAPAPATETAPTAAGPAPAAATPAPAAETAPAPAAPAPETAPTAAGPAPTAVADQATTTRPEAAAASIADEVPAAGAPTGAEAAPTGIADEVAAAGAPTGAGSAPAVEEPGAPSPDQDPLPQEVSALPDADAGADDASAALGAAVTGTGGEGTVPPEGGTAGPGA